MRIGLLAFVAIAACSTATAQPQAAPDWLAGYWLSCERGEVAESWIGAGVGVLLGTNQSEGGAAFEFLRVAPSPQGGIGYFSMPNGRSPATEFHMVSHANQRAVFENPTHDFPQRIIYERQGDLLHARIEDMAASRGMDWSFRRVPQDTRCAR